MTGAGAPLLEVENLRLSIGTFPILNGVSLSLDRGEVLGIVGESGSGKSMTANAVMRLLPAGTTMQAAIRLDGRSLDALDEGAMCAIRGREIGMIFQEPMTALNPVQTIGAQVAETIRLHTGASRVDALARAREALDRVGLPADRFPLDRYPHDLSGGQRQRVVIAIAIALKPRLLIADEPTTALDVTTQAQILALLKRLVDEEGCGLILITHDLAVVAGIADRIAVMRAGAIVETGPASAVLSEPVHPYTRALIKASTHRPERRRVANPAPAEPILAVDGAVRDYPLPRRSLFERPRTFRAVDHVSLTIGRGENVGLVGESGCGKSTLTRAILALERLQGGSIALAGKAFAGPGLPLGSAADRTLRRRIQAVFQDPYGSFNPRHRVGRLIAEPFHLDPAAPTGRARDKRVAGILEAVGLKASDALKYIHEFSGGQRQRIAIARALVIAPDLIILDEAVSALDVSIRAQILDLIADLTDRFGISTLFLSHDLAVVRAITDRVFVMRAGRIVESGPTETVFSNPQHEYTRTLIAATPDLTRALADRSARKTAPVLRAGEP